MPDAHRQEGNPGRGPISRLAQLVWTWAHIKCAHPRNSDHMIKYTHSYKVVYTLPHMKHIHLNKSHSHIAKVVWE